MPETIAIVPQFRSIGGIVAQVTIRESHRDDLTITEHPVENGANISDHAYKRPSEVEIEIGWDGTTGNPSDFYNQLLALQAQRLPFDIYTGKRPYKNMLVAGIATVTEQRTEYSLMAIVRCRQINLVSTQSTVVSQPQGAQANPAATSSYIDQGTSGLLDGSALNTQSPTWQSLSATDEDIKAALGGTVPGPTVPLPSPPQL